MVKKVGSNENHKDDNGKLDLETNSNNNNILTSRYVGFISDIHFR